MASELCGKLYKNVEIRASPSQFHHMFTHKPHHISNHSSNNIQSCELHDGDWGTVGSVVYWNYFHDGQKRVAKEVVEAIDSEKNLIAFRVIEGDLMEHFKSFLITIQADPKPDGTEGSVIHWTMEYEKLHDEIIDPHTLLQFTIDVSKDLESHLLEESVTTNGLCGKVEANIEIKASPKKFHDLFRHKPHHLSNVSSEKIHGVELHDGEWGTVGSTVYWKYFHDGKACVAKEVVEAIDDENNSITYRVLEGDLMEHFKSFLITVKASPKPEGGEGSVVHWTLEYEKKHGEIVDPHTLLQLAIELSNDLEAHLLEDN